MKIGKNFGACRVIKKLSDKQETITNSGMEIDGDSMAHISELEDGETFSSVINEVEENLLDCRLGNCSVSSDIKSSIDIVEHCIDITSPELDVDSRKDQIEAGNIPASVSMDCKDIQIIDEVKVNIKWFNQIKIETPTTEVICEEMTCKNNQDEVNMDVNKLLEVDPLIKYETIDCDSIVLTDDIKVNSNIDPLKVNWITVKTEEMDSEEKTDFCLPHEAADPNIDLSHHPEASHHNSHSVKPLSERDLVKIYNLKPLSVNITRLSKEVLDSFKIK
jgi:hypothetical protein